MSVGGRGVALALLVGGSLALSGCATGYVMRAAYEEAGLLWRRVPITDVLQDETLDAATREKLELVLAVRAYAAEHLGLRVGGSYTSYATVDGSQVIHVVSAAPRERLVPVTWWFPIVGRVPYRGYFDLADAEALAAELRREGNDTLVRPAIAFSTLGWFDDPLPSTLLRQDQARLAETVIHELTHNTLYVPNEAAFNESFATYVGLRGAEAFFTARGDPTRAALCAARTADALTFSAFLAAAITRLDAVYAQGIAEPARQDLLAELQRQAAGQQWLTNEYAGFWRRPLNNAVVVHDRLYADRLALFEQAYAARGGDLRQLIDAFVAAPGFTLPDAADQGSMASSRRSPTRTEMINTAATSVSTAPNDRPTEVQIAGEIGAPRKRLLKTSYTGQASNITTRPMNDRHSTM
jgi:predicted aminopeptidase